MNQCIHIKTNHEITLDILLFVIIFRLKIENTVPQDSGYYMCKASNRGGEKNSTAYGYTDFVISWFVFIWIH
jgi:hypothetical protein